MFKKNVLDYAKKQQSPHTLFVHRDNGHQISLYDNLLYALALLRTKTAESVLEARNLVDKLLAFQMEKGPYKGHFPRYLHEFPEAKDLYLPIKILPLFYQIQKEFLGKEITHVMRELSSLCGQIALTFPYAFTWKIMKHLLDKEPLEESFFKEAYEKRGNFHAEDWGQILYALSLLPDKTQAEVFYMEVKDLYHEELGCFTGCPHNEVQEAFRPKRTLLDLYLDPKPFSDQVLLEGAKVEAFSFPVLSRLDFRKILSERGSWAVYKLPAYSYAALESKEESPYQKNAHLFRLIWGKDHPHTLIFPEVSYPVSIEAKENQILFTCTLPEALPQEGKEDIEIPFYFDAAKEALFHVNGVKANTFRMGETFSVEKEGMRLSFTYKIVEGEGKFFGHLLKANRPSQLLQISKADFTAYDWKIALRTISRSSHCKVMVSVDILPSC